MTRLFIEASATKMNVLKADAVRAVESLPRAHFLNPALAGSLETIIAAHVTRLAQFKPGGISKSRRKELNARVAPEVTLKFLSTVTLAAKIRPQNLIAIENEFDFMKVGVTCSVQDGDMTDQAIDHLVDLIGRNLESLPKEREDWPTTLTTEVRRVADILVEQVGRF